MTASITRIATIQHSLRELGRIRLGEKGPKGEPRKLKTFRLTSASRDYVNAAAEAYGGTVRDWDSPRGREYEVTIESTTLDVLVPPGQTVMQAFEMWTAGGCARRCDGLRQETGDACACPADTEQRNALAAKGQACKPTTRLWVILPRLPDLGRWRLETHGFYAAVELPGMAEIASMATSQGVMLPARLRIDQRRRKIPGQPVRDYIVPVLELPETNFAQLVASGHIATTNAIAAPEAAPKAPALKPGRAAKAERPALGAPPALPEKAEFERAASPSFGGAPELGPGGWPVDSASPAAAAPATPLGDAAAASTTSPAATAGVTTPVAAQPDGSGGGNGEPPAAAPAAACADPSPYTDGESCGLAKGHSGNHKSRNRESWAPKGAQH